MLPYDKEFINAITYEVEPTKYASIKKEMSILDYSTKLGGFSSLLLGVSKIMNTLESVHLYVASDLL